MNVTSLSVVTIQLVYNPGLPRSALRRCPSAIGSATRYAGCAEAYGAYPIFELFLLLDVVLPLSLARVSGTLFLPTSLQHLLASLSKNV